MKYLNICSILTLLAVLFGACSRAPFPVVECPSLTFDYNEWHPLDGRDSMVFKNDLDELAVFRLDSIYISEGYTISEEDWEEEPVTACYAGGAFTYLCAELQLELRIQFEQVRESTQTMEDQSVTARYGFKTIGANEIRRYSHQLNIRPELMLFDRYTLHDSLEIDENYYYDIIEAIIDSTSLGLPDTDVIYWRILVKEGTGLIQFSDAAGMGYTLVE